MKFLMKSTLSGIIPLGNTPHSLSSPIGNVLSGCLRVVENLYNYSFFGRISWPLAKRAQKQEIAWMPIIKATTHIENTGIHFGLKGQSILCVGGQEKYYPIYRNLVENAGGHLVTFHGDANDSFKKLHQRLEKTDMVICPVDCVNHEAYFTVKHYCQFTGKRCALLDRSQTAVFKKGIEKLVSMTEK